MVYQCDYSGLQSPGPARETMLAAMREVLAVGNAEGVPLSEADVALWTDVVDNAQPHSEPSMRQDGKAHRKSEVELFSGTIRRLAQKHGLNREKRPALPAAFFIPQTRKIRFPP